LAASPSSTTTIILFFYSYSELIAATIAKFFSLDTPTLVSRGKCVYLIIYALGLRIEKKGSTFISNLK
jgi:hypothetical protein